MAIDPRIDALAQYAMSELGAGPTDETAMLRQRVEKLERLVDVLMRTPTIQLGAGTPAGLPARDGTPYAQTTPAFWVKFPTGWRGVSLPLT